MSGETFFYRSKSDGHKKPAQRAGFEKGDIILTINDQPVINPELLVKKIQESGSAPIAFTLLRNNVKIKITNVQAELKKSEKLGKYMIGIQIEQVTGERTLYFPTPWQQFSDVISRTYMTFRGLFDEKNPIKARHMSGPVGIFHILYVVVSSAGFIAALNLIILISFSLAIMNLFPLPILDGGHIVLGIVEGLLNRRIPYKFNLCMSYAFMLILVSFMLYVTYHDARRVTKSFAPATRSTQMDKPKIDTPQPAKSISIEEQQNVP